MICRCCNIKEADKKNTHYLTDAIIRKCLNENGTNLREKGFMFGLSNKSPFVEFGFQRETNTTSIIDALRREPSVEEINEAKKNPFSVDHFFCSDCEKLFTNIESEFINDILPKLRGINFEKINQRTIEFVNCFLIRKFFLLQFWRTSICDSAFDLKVTFKEKLHNGIFQDDPVLSKIPLRITHLNTVGTDLEYTKNIVGILKGKSNFAIFFNDFIIQAFEKTEDINFIEFYGLNQKDNFIQSFNVNENRFIIDILFNQERIYFASTLNQNDLAPKIIGYYQNIFVSRFYTTFGYQPKPQLISSFIHGILYDKNCSEEKRYSIERIQSYANDFFLRLINKC